MALFLVYAQKGENAHSISISARLVPMQTILKDWSYTLRMWHQN